MLADEKRSTKSLTSELKNVKAELKLMKYQPQKSSRSNAGMTSYTKKSFTKRDQLNSSFNLLSPSVVEVSDKVIGEGTFGSVKEGFFKTLDIMCAVKEAKIPEYFDALSECSCLQKLQGSPNFSVFLWSCWKCNSYGISVG